MVSPYKRSSAGNWQIEHFLQLASGVDFFNATGWSCPSQIAKRSSPRRFADDIGPDEWPTPEAIEEMADCWKHHRGEVEAIAGRMNPGVPSWAELVFERGIPPLEAQQEQINLKLALDPDHDNNWDDSNLPEEFRGVG